MLLDEYQKAGDDGSSLNCSHLQQLLFHQHYEERIMGLLGALIPDVSKVLFTTDVCTVALCVVCFHVQYCVSLCVFIYAAIDIGGSDSH